VNDIDLGDIFSSSVHGAPATPIFTAAASQKIRVRLLYPSGHRRQNAYTLWGAEWPHLPWEVGARSRVIGYNPLARARGTEDGLGPMTAFDVVPYYAAGGLFRVPGDRLYLNQGSYKLSDGLWGVFRVTP
jgi:manganese oxidase